MISLRKPTCFIFTALILFCGNPLQAQVATDDDILDLIVPVLSSTSRNTSTPNEPPLPNFSRKTLSMLAKETGVSLSKIQRIVVAHATDPLTLPQLKSECNRWIKIFDVDQCDPGAGYTNYKRVMNCEWYIDATVVGNSSVFDIDSSKVINNFIENFTNYVVERIKASVDRTLRDSAVSGLAAAIVSGGTAAYSAFIGTFTGRLVPELGIARDEIINYIANLSFIKVSSFPDINNFSNIQQSCGWSDWETY